jgi:hypothetical protein
VLVEKIGSQEWDLARNGRIAVVAPLEPKQGAAVSQGEHTVMFLLNLLDELRRRVK